MSASTEEPAELRRRIEQLEGELTRFREDEEFLVQTLVSATRHASEIRDTARAEGELILRNATAEAEERSKTLELERHDAEQELARLRKVTDEMRQGLSRLLNTMLGDLQSETGEEPKADEDAASQNGSASLGGALEAALEERMQSVIEPEPVASVDAEAAPPADEPNEVN